MEEKLQKIIDKIIDSKPNNTLCLRNPQVIYRLDGHVKMKMKITKDSLNPYGMIHGGMLFTLCDNCAGLAAISLGKRAVTLNSNINYIKSIGQGYIFAESEIVHKGKTTVVVNVSVEDEDKNLLCTSTFTMFSLGSLDKWPGLDKM